MRLTVKPGDRFSFIKDDDLAGATMTVLATPMGWMHDTFVPDNRARPKLFHSAMVPDKDHLMNPCSFWPAVLWGDFQRSEIDQPGVTQQQLIAEWVFDMGDEPPTHLTMDEKDAIHRGAVHSFMSLPEVRHEIVGTQEQTSLPVSDRSAIPMLQDIWSLIRDYIEECPNIHLASAMSPGSGDDGVRVPVMFLNKKSGKKIGKQYRLVLLEDFN